MRTAGKRKGDVRCCAKREDRKEKNVSHTEVGKQI